MSDSSANAPRSRRDLLAAALAGAIPVAVVIATGLRSEAVPMSRSLPPLLGQPSANRTPKPGPGASPEAPPAATPQRLPPRGRDRPVLGPTPTPRRRQPSRGTPAPGS